MAESETGQTNDVVRRENENLEEGEIPPQKDNAEDSTEPGEKSLPLEHAWTIWFDNPQMRSKGNWGASLRKVYTFSTVEDFWCLYNNITPPSSLMAGADLCCFKDGIAPKWEDEKCKKGGKWTVKCPKKTVMDTMWLHALLAMIGEQFDDGDDICGLVLSARAKGDRIALWTKTASNEDVQCNLGKQLKEFVSSTERIGFLAHEDAMRDERNAKDSYFA